MVKTSHFASQSLLKITMKMSFPCGEERSRVCAKRLKTPGPKNDTRRVKEQDEEEGGDDKVELVRASPGVVSVFGDSENVHGNDVQVVAVVNSVVLPHMRCHCTVHPFCSAVCLDGILSGNVLCCPHCYCYVCDVPAKVCSDWNMHCEAADTSEYWRNERFSRQLTAENDCSESFAVVRRR